MENLPLVHVWMLTVQKMSLQLPALRSLQPETVPDIDLLLRFPVAAQLAPFYQSEHSPQYSFSVHASVHLFCLHSLVTSGSTKPRRMRHKLNLCVSVVCFLHTDAILNHIFLVNFINIEI